MIRKYDYRGNVYEILRVEYRNNRLMVQLCDVNSDYHTWVDWSEFCEKSYPVD